MQAVAEDHSVRPMRIVLVELGLGSFARESVEIGKQVDLSFSSFCTCLAAATQVVDQHLGMHLLLDVERRRRNNQIGPVLLVLASPNELRIEVAVPPLVGHADRALLLGAHHRLKLSRGYVLARSLLVRKCFDLLSSLFVLRVFFAILIPYAGCGTVTDSIILLNSDSTFDLKSDSI